MFKKNPKALAQDAAEKLYASQGKVTIAGARRSDGECKSLRIPIDSYIVELWVAGKFIQSTHARNWRTAYKLLKIAIETSSIPAVQIPVATV